MFSITRNVKCQLLYQNRKYLVVLKEVVLIFKMCSIAMEEYELMKDSKYRMYVAAVDKALKNFEYTSEWADLIAALGKLNKVLLQSVNNKVLGYLLEFVFRC